MKKEFVKRLVIPGVVTVVLFAASIVYTALFNGGRFIAPMDFSAYVYRPGDLPVLLARKERLVRKAKRANRSLMMISPRSSLRR